MSKRLGVSHDLMVQTILRAPSLAARKAGGMARRSRLVIRIAVALGHQVTAADVLRMLPAALTYGQERLLGRYVIARLGLWTWTWTALLSLPASRAAALLEGYLQAHSGEARVVRLRAALARRSIIPAFTNRAD